MFGIDGTEFLVILLVAAVVIGPEDVPKMLRAFMQAAARLRALAQEFRGHFDEAVRRADMGETADVLRDIGNSVRELDPRRNLRDFYASLERETAEAHERRRLREAPEPEVSAPEPVPDNNLGAAAAEQTGANAAAQAAVEGAGGGFAPPAETTARHPLAWPAGAARLNPQPADIEQIRAADAQKAVEGGGGGDNGQRSGEGQ